MLETNRPVPEPDGYEPPSVATLGSAERLTASVGDAGSVVTTTTTISDAALKTEIEVVARAVERLRRLGPR